MNYENKKITDIIQSKFSQNEIVKCSLMQVSLSQDLDNRLLAIVKHDTSYILFILISSPATPSTFSDLTIERALPIDANFQYDIDCKPNIVVLNISSYQIKHKVYCKPGEQTYNFIVELLRSIKDQPPTNFQWLKKYSNIVTISHYNTMSSNNSSDMDSLDIIVPRQSIAQGHVNVTARDSLLRYHMALKEADYTHLQDITICVATWNVNGQPPTVSLLPWLACDTDPPDVYAVGFQELDLSKEAFFFNDTPREEEWQSAVSKAVHPGARYRQVALVRLVGMLLIVLVRYELYSYVSNVAVDTVGTGIMGKMGNKGGVGVRLDLHNTSLCFVNSHLAAHTEEVERRNQDYHDICARMSFVRPQPHTIKDHDQVYWLGDLNYRITELTAREVKERLNRGEIESVLLSDQLGQQHSKGRVLSGFTEAPITFQPTYKYDPGTDHYDTSEKARAPAWCDRVLWRGKGIRVVTYRSQPELRISDHKPVSAIFKSQIKVVDPTKYRKTHEEVLKKMDKLENEFLPQVTVDRTEINFGTVRFLESQEQELIIANTGQVPVQFEFIKKLNDDSYCKDWLRITPFSGHIMPGEKCDVQLEVQLKSAQENLYDILVLHLEGGKDVFITVTGDCQRSCFTTTFTTLCKAPVPVGHLTPHQLVQMKTRPLLYSIPRELWLLIDHLYRHGLKQRNLFESRSLHQDLIRVRDWLDYDSADIPPASAHVVAEALLLLLLSTPEPVIPHDLHNQCIAASPNYTHCKQIIAQLPEVERNVFLYICLFIQELINHGSDNGMDAKTLSTIFGDVLLPSPIGQCKPQASRSKAAFVHHFLVNDHSDLIAMHQ